MSAAAADPYAALRYASYRRYLTGNFLANTGRQAFNIAISWQIYRWTNSATALALVGLVNVVPLLVCILPAGTLADRYDRRRIIQITVGLSLLLSLALLLLIHAHDQFPRFVALDEANRILFALARMFERQVAASELAFTDPVLPLVYLILFLQAILRVLAGPARGAFVPTLVPTETVRNAVTWSASSFELSTVLGPAVGGGLVAWFGYTTVYALEVISAGVFGVLLFGVRPLAAATRRGSQGMLAGIEFLRKNKPVLAALSLDLFAVLLGGATALLPLYADKILHVGPAGLGWLRAAPAAGAILMAFISAHRPSPQRPGIVMLWSVAAFGAALGVFSLSTSFWLSLAALFVSGMCDNYSVVVRHSLVQLLTPDSLRGRVSAVNQLFIGCSNEISALRAGLMAALFGPVAAAGLGGLATIAVTGFITWIAPSLRTVPPLDQLKSKAERRDEPSPAP